MLNSFLTVFCQLGHRWVFEVLAYSDEQYRCSFSPESLGVSEIIFFIPINGVIR